MAEEVHNVTLNVSALSQGLARQLSTTLLGKAAIEGIWSGADTPSPILIPTNIFQSTTHPPPMTVRDGVATHASICQRSGSTNVMETDCREHVVAELDCCVAFDVNAHSAPNMGFEGLKNMETAAFDVNAYSTANLCLDGHTGVFVYGNEYYFGGGIQHAPVGTTPYGRPIREISPRYTAETYSLLTHNCNDFSNEVAQFLVGSGIPDYILLLPNEVMSSPMGALLMPMIQNLETTLRAGAVPQVPQFTPSVSAQPSQSTTVNVNRPSNITHQKEVDNKVKDREQPKSEEIKTSPSNPAGAHGKSQTGGTAADPLGDTGAKIQEEITREFAAIMATGTLRASEAAALATRKVMQKYGHLNVAMPQS
ncbi:chitinase family protein [Hibiscus syriacus]|uniref:Chitinase family protein n=1 Tax=Hibiscus syriacus TaxID=106335 RepID=A0A6A2XH66_HIBSY|nr:chitinase family protein [Hibiscus syriacus]